MRTALARLCVLALLAVTACAAPGPSFSGAAGTMPPLPPGQARVFLYRWLEPYDSVSMSVAFLNGQPIGATEPGAVLYRDVVPGQYTISVVSDGTYPNQFKTVVLRPGETVYARIESLQSWSTCGRWAEACGDTFVVQVMDPASALAEMQGLRFIGG
jgi:hypothetical protein